MARSQAMERVISPKPDWFERTPFAKEIGLIALGLGMGMMIGSGWTNTAKINEVYSNARGYVRTHVPQSTPSKTESPTTNPVVQSVDPRCVETSPPKPFP